MGPRRDSSIAPAEPSTHSSDIPLVIDLSAVIEPQEITSPFTETGVGEAHAVKDSAIRMIPKRFIGNPHHF